MSATVNRPVGVKFKGVAQLELYLGKCGNLLLLLAHNCTYICAHWLNDHYCSSWPTVSALFSYGPLENRAEQSTFIKTTPTIWLYIMCLLDVTSLTRDFYSTFEKVLEGINWVSNSHEKKQRLEARKTININLCHGQMYFLFSIKIPTLHAGPCPSW